MRFSFEHTRSDFSSPVINEQCQNFGAYSWYIFLGTGLFNIGNDYDIRSRLTLSVGIGCSENQSWKLIDKALSKWATHNKYLYNDYYQLSAYNNTGTGALAMEFNDNENGNGMLAVYLRDGKDYTAVAKGLIKNQMYKVWNEDFPDDVITMTGKELMTSGYTVSAKRKGIQYAAIIWYEAIK